MKIFGLTAVAALAAIIAGWQLKELGEKKKIRQEKNAEIQSIIAGMNKIPTNVKPHILCQLEWRASRWGAVKQAIESAERAGVKIDLYKIGIEAQMRMWADMASFAFEAIKAFEGNSQISCVENQNPQPPRLEFGRNAYTLLVALGTFREAELGEPAILREHAMSLLKEWVAIRKAGGDPKADRTVEDVGRAFSISNFDLGLNTPEQSRKYYQQLE